MSYLTLALVGLYYAPVTDMLMGRASPVSYMIPAVLSPSQMTTATISGGWSGKSSMHHCFSRFGVNERCHMKVQTH